MRRTALASLLLLALVTGGPAAGASPPDAGGQWTMIARTPGHVTVIEDGNPAITQSPSWSLALPLGKDLQPGVQTVEIGAASYKKSQPAMAASGASYHRGAFYADTFDGRLFKISPRGRVLWVWQAPNVLMTEPVFYRNLVFAGAGNNLFDVAGPRAVSEAGYIRGTGPNGIYAVDTRTGKTAWSFPTPGEAMPTFAVADGRVFAPTGDRHLYVLDAATGRLVRAVFDFGFDSMSSPALAGQRIVFGVNDPEAYLAVDTRTLAIVWAFHPSEAVGGMDSPAVDGDRVFVETAEVPWEIQRFTPFANRHAFRQVLYALDLATGDVLWRADLGGGPKPANGQISGQVLAAGGVVYATSALTGRVYAYRAADGARLWSASLPHGALTKAQPDLADGLLLVGASDRGLYGLDPASGAVRLRLPLPGPVSVGGMLVIDGHVAVLTANGDFALLQLPRANATRGGETP